jgi:hypothetical protein
LGVCEIVSSNNKPWVGVFVSSGTIYSLNHLKEEFPVYFRFIGLARASKKIDMPLYFFCVDDVNLPRSLIKGTWYNEQKQKWEKETFPLPDILYDRCGRLNAVKERKAALIRARFTELGIKSINPRHFFDKWATYNYLWNNEKVRMHLPVTHRLRSKKDVRRLLKISNKVYVKSVDGNRGTEVVCVTKHPNSGYEYKYFVNHLVVGTGKHLKPVYKKMSPIFAGKKAIVQQAIPLLSIKGRLVDFRAEMQRNGQGRLEIIGICARIGLHKSPITIHSKAYPFEDFYRNYLNYSEEEIMQLRSRVEYFIVNVYESMEEKYGPFGEIGIDLGIDKDGNIWFIECNAKSAKVSLYKAYDEKTVEKAFLNPLEYARYIYMKQTAENASEHTIKR